MIVVKNTKIVGGEIKDVVIDSADEVVIDADGRLMLIPALIDCHVHFRTPGHEYKEDWSTGAQAAIAGGVTTVFDMPNTDPPVVDKESLEGKMQLIERQLAEADIPLRYHLYLGADKKHLDEIGQVKDQVIALKAYMGSSTGGLLMDDDEGLDRLFQIAAQRDMIVAVHAEDEDILRANKEQYAGETDPAVHSRIRDRTAAIKAVTQAIELAEKYNTQLSVLHVSTKEEIELIRDAKQNHILVYAEVCPHHLVFTEEDYKRLGTKIQMNPPVRTKQDQDALWEAIQDGTVDTVGSDHAPHTLEEKMLPYGQAPSGVPGVEMILPILLNAYNQGKIALDRIIDLTRINPQEIYQLKPNKDVVLVDLDLEKEVREEELKSKCGWSPYAGMVLKGWPKYTILKGRVYEL